MTPATRICHCLPKEHVTYNFLLYSSITGKTYSVKRYRDVRFFFLLKKMLTAKVDSAK